MSRNKHAVRRIVLVFALAVAAQMLLAPATSTPGPYLSALSSLTVTATAFPINCPNNSCGGKKGCRSDHSFYCTLDATGCQTSKCL